MLQRIVNWISDAFFSSEYKCPKCKGKGRVYKWETYPNSFTKTAVLCENCKGSGKIDFIEKVAGKK